MAACCEIPAFEGTVGNGDFFIPNVFNRDGDGINDLFYVQGQADSVAKVLYLYIYNEDSLLVFSEFDFPINNPVYGWDGQYNGDLPRGVFNYFGEVQAVNGASAPFEGRICSFPCLPGDELEPVFEYFSQCLTPSQHDGEGGGDPNLPSGEEWNCLEF